jgi:hypothetical protein
MAFLACIAGVTFPITGTILWINRVRKKNPSSAPIEAEEEFEEAVA